MIVATKIRAPEKNIEGLFCKIQVIWNKAGVLILRSFMNLFMSQTRGLPLRPKLRKANRFLFQKDWRYVSVCHLFSALRVVVC